MTMTMTVVVVGTDLPTFAEQNGLRPFDFTTLPTGGYQHSEDGFHLQDVDTPRNHDTLYAVVHKANRGHQVNPRTDPDVVMQTACDRPVQRQIYDNVAADKGNVLPPPTLGIPSQSCSDEPQDGDVYYSYCH